MEKNGDYVIKQFKIILREFFSFSWHTKIYFSVTPSISNVVDSTVRD